jgi:hypothetical protein
VECNAHGSAGPCSGSPNDPVQQRGRLQWLQTLGNRNAGPVCCND